VLQTADLAARRDEWLKSRRDKEQKVAEKKYSEQQQKRDIDEANMKRLRQMTVHRARPLPRHIYQQKVEKSEWCACAYWLESFHSNTVLDCCSFAIMLSCYCALVFKMNTLCWNCFDKFLRVTVIIFVYVVNNNITVFQSL